MSPMHFRVNVHVKELCLNVKELLARNRHNIWSLFDCNRSRTHNHLACKQAPKHLVPKRVRGIIRTFSQVHRTYKYSQHSSIMVIVALWLTVFLQLTGCGFESCCSHLILFSKNTLVINAVMTLRCSKTYIFFFWEKVQISNAYISRNKLIYILLLTLLERKTWLQNTLILRVPMLWDTLWQVAGSTAMPVWDAPVMWSSKVCYWSAKML